VEGFPVDVAVVDEDLGGYGYNPRGCSEYKIALSDAVAPLKSSLTVDLVFLEFPLVGVAVRKREPSPLALSLLPETFEPASVLVGHHTLTLVPPALESALVAIAIVELPPLAVLHVALPLTFIDGAIRLEVHRVVGHGEGFFSRAAAHVLLVGRVVVGERANTEDCFVLLRQLFFTGTLRPGFSRLEESSFRLGCDVEQTTVRRRAEAQGAGGRRRLERSLLEHLQQLGCTWSQLGIELQASFEDGQQRRRDLLSLLFIDLARKNLLLDKPGVAVAVEQIFLGH